MKLYLQLVRLLRRAGTLFGVAMGVAMVIATDWTTGLACGFISGLLLTLGAPALLLAFKGLKNWHAVHSEI